jgi:hypothetical protein
MTKAKNESFIPNTIEVLEQLLKKLKSSCDISQKSQILDTNPNLQSYFAQFSEIKKGLLSLSLIEQFVVKSVLAIGQGHIVFHHFEKIDFQSSTFKKLLEVLVDIEQAYDTIGGVIGYHLTVLKLIVAKQDKPSKLPKNIKYSHPPGIDISKDSLETRRAIRNGIEALDHIAEMYPVGGAGDRLDLHDATTDEALPAAVLEFCGRTLLEGLIRDLQAKEYLYYKLMGKQIITPIAMMTSHEKDNHQNITRVCKENGWFGRPEDSIRFFVQPLVPVITIKGDWVILEPLKPCLKPGGHGVIWKLAEDEGIFDWFIDQGYRFALLRQINNPIAGLDYGLSAFQGWGSKHNKAFGFASCQRYLNVAEGMDVLVERETANGIEYSITNIEYTEFEQYGIKDVPIKHGGVYSEFPANTNLLFVNLEVVRQLVEKCPIPGMMINMKGKTSVCNGDRIAEEIPSGRLESTMQNIADYIVDRHPKHLKDIKPDDLQTFLTYNDRRKTISVTKKSYKEGESFRETPEGCLYELLQAHADLLRDNCKFKVPVLGNEEEYLKEGPGFIFLFNPALGPMYQIISQKIQKGQLSSGSELQLEISELEIKDLVIEGSLLILADNVTGHEDKKGLIRNSEICGKCELQRVKVKNLGIDKDASKPYWKNHFMHKEMMRIVLHGDAEFCAKDVVFEGNVEIEVPAGHRMEAYMESGKVKYHLEKIQQPTWYWKYAFDAEDRIVLDKVLQEQMNSEASIKLLKKSTKPISVENKH